MNKIDIIEKVAIKLNLSKGLVKEVVDGSLDIIIKALKNNEEVNIPNFGKFETKEKKGRELLIPSTNELIKIEDHKVVTFKVSKTLKESIK